MLNLLFIVSYLILLNVVVSNNVLLLWFLPLLRWFFLLSGFSLSCFLFLSFCSFLLRLPFRFLLGFLFFPFFFLPLFFLHLLLCCCCFSLLLFRGLSLGCSLSLSFSLGLHRLLLSHLGCNFIIVLLISFRTTAKNLLNVESGIDS